eukprot:gene7910-biopygen2606
MSRGGYLLLNSTNTVRLSNAATCSRAGLEMTPFRVISEACPRAPRIPWRFPDSNDVMNSGPLAGAGVVGGSLPLKTHPAAGNPGTGLGYAHTPAAFQPPMHQMGAHPAQPAAVHGHPIQQQGTLPDRARMMPSVTASYRAH